MRRSRFHTNRSQVSTAPFCLSQSHPKCCVSLTTSDTKKFLFEQLLEKTTTTADFWFSPQCNAWIHCAASTSSWQQPRIDDCQKWNNWNMRNCMRNFRLQPSPPPPNHATEDVFLPFAQSNKKRLINTRPNSSFNSAWNSHTLEASQHPKETSTERFFETTPLILSKPRNIMQNY